MATTKKVVLVNGEQDWSGVYVDGKLAVSNSSISLEEFADIVKGQAFTFESIRTVENEWLENEQFPENLSDIPINKFTHVVSFSNNKRQEF